LLLVLNPSGELLRSVDINAEKHQSELRTTELCALAEIQPSHLGVDPHRVNVIGDQVGLPDKLRDPEAMVYVS
jgi:hypothetical protein